MKNRFVKLILTLSIPLMTLWIAGCQNEEVGPAAADVQEAESDVAIESSYSEVEELSFSGIFATSQLGGRIEQDPRLACATVGMVENPTGVFTVTIDFGTGCEGPDGRIRKGIIKVTHDGQIWAFGSQITVELTGFSINDVLIEGTRVVTNKTTGTSPGIVHEITMTGGKVTWLDGTFATRNVTRVRTWIRDSVSPLNDEVWIGGSANGTNRNGVSYSMQITNNLVFKASCIAGKIFIPVSGTKEIITDKVTVLVDFGDGTCDRLATVTVNGRSKEVTINQI